MEHSFDCSIAREVGVAGALIFKHISFWVEENEKKKKYCYEGRYWTYNTIQSFCEKFPYLTDYEIKKAIKILLEKEYILEGNFNHNKMNRTRWFSIKNITKPSEIPICRNQQMHLSNSTNAKVENDKSNNKDTIIKVYNRGIIEPPTLEELKSFAKENSCEALADKFFKYYSINHWLEKNGEPINWKQKLITWANTEGRFTGNYLKGTENFKGRSYDDIDTNEFFQSIDEIQI